ncbi:PepSY domain-containing protein [Porphyromonas circumdentaria]|uniref:PepSY-associated TM region n=1 Tax=Porphyromonas circumdentaria TaxID=29524 RepID=A0A1T4L2Y2_9PORP|nr:PepSY domain-containing protein [Porphyromonas circumdentaria]MBB6275203.1 hypothetical protein [Porphyromonas circumdentaria]MDO4721833.1 PepSY domain-containing protein [Porphyromonas circumdentaria]SJZ49003.1 PepSY-associated TM region [Porphyromonas circumdentaria]
MLRGLIRWHKWLSWLLTIFLLFFAVSGIILNHRSALSDIDISRGLLPPSYRYNNWNQGSMVGTLSVAPGRNLVYGYSGIWSTDSLANRFTDFSKGLPRAADRRMIRALREAPSGTLFAVTPYNLYQYQKNQWNVHPLGIKRGDAHFTDLTFKGDSMLVLSRSELFLSLPPYTHFTQLPLKKPEGYKPQASLFRTLWMLHSGALFGTVGILIVDVIGVLLIILIVTGILISLYRIRTRKNKQKKLRNNTIVKRWNSSLQWHNWVGKSFFILLLLITLTGMFLRPPLLVPIARTKVPTVPGTALHSDNPWEDKLRKLRYDPTAGDWLLSSSEGFFSLRSLDAEPQRVASPPPVSVMGVNVLEQEADGLWVVGSFSGIYLWDRAAQTTFDYISRELVQPARGGMPSFDNAICGFSPHFAQGPLVVDYRKGAFFTTSNLPSPPMPEGLAPGSISLWQVALEAHTGRLFIPHTTLSLLYIFVAGLFILVIIISGYIVYKKRYVKSRKTEKK